MGELGNGHRRKQDLPEILHLEPHGIRVESHAGRILHPAVGHQDPQGGKIGADRHHPGGKQMKSFGHPVPAEKHHGKKGGLEKEGHDTLDRERGAEDITEHP